MIVDVHAHCYPKPYIEELRKIGAGEEGGIGIKIPAWSTAEKSIHTLNDLGIDVQVLSLSAPNVYFQDVGLSRELAQMTNDYISDICKRYPQRFMGFASVPLNNLKYAFEELERARKILNMDGVVLGTTINGIPLSDDQFVPFFEELDRENIPVALHPMKTPGEDEFSEEDLKLRIPSSVGFVCETTKTIARMIFKGLFERCQNLIFILPHSGGTVPFLYPRWDIAYLFVPETHPLRAIPNPPSYYLKKLYYDTALSYYHSSLRCTLDLAGVNHILFGTDFPYTRGPVAQETIGRIESYGFSEEEKREIYFKNAMKLFPKLAEKFATL